MRKKAFIALVIFLLISGAVGFRHMYLRTPPQDATGKEADIARLFDGRTVSESYINFKSRYANLAEREQHSAAHIFGRKLYEHAGIAGFSVCDSSFGFGCFHTFIPLAIADHGEAVVAELDRSCVKTYGAVGLGCSHGIGHGLAAYFGYTENGLQKALILCDSLSWKSPYGGCRDGAFMEYNLRTMIADPLRRARPFSSTEQYRPCISVSGKSQIACYFNLPQWWQRSLQEESAPPENVGKLCAGVSRDALQEACFRGVGYSFGPITQFDATRGAALCDNLPISRLGKIRCREGLAWALWADPVHRAQAEPACTLGLTKNESDKCNREYLFTIK